MEKHKEHKMKNTNNIAEILGINAALKLLLDPPKDIQKLEIMETLKLCIIFSDRVWSELSK